MGGKSKKIKQRTGKYEWCIWHSIKREQNNNKIEILIKVWNNQLIMSVMENKMVSLIKHKPTLLRGAGAQTFVQSYYTLMLYSLKCLEKYLKRHVQHLFN